MNKKILIEFLVGIVLAGLVGWLLWFLLLRTPVISPVGATGNGNNHVNGCFECPTFSFSAKECPAGYHEFGPVFCEKNGPQFDLEPYNTFGPIQVTYDKSEDPNHCHRPTAQSQGVPSWATNEYNEDLDELADAIPVECPVVDLCENLDGVQENLPPNYQSEQGNCTCQEGYHTEEYGNGHEYEIPECVPDELEDPEEPESTPSAEPKGDPPIFAGSSTESPAVCSVKDIGNVANINVKTTDNSGELEVQWSLPERADKVHIEYGLEQNAQHALLNTPNDGNEVIRDLVSGNHYWFRVAGVRDCGVGSYSNWFDPLVP